MWSYHDVNFRAGNICQAIWRESWDDKARGSLSLDSKFEVQNTGIKPITGTSYTPRYPEYGQVRRASINTGVTGNRYARGRVIECERPD